MRYAYFFTYNIVGGVVWTASFLSVGYFFGNMPFVEKNFSMVVMGIIVVSLLPPVFEYFKEKKAAKTEVGQVSEAE